MLQSYKNEPEKSIKYEWTLYCFSFFDLLCLNYEHKKDMRGSQFYNIIHAREGPL